MTRRYGDVTPLERWRLLGSVTAIERRAVVRVVYRRYRRGAVQIDDPRLCGRRIATLYGSSR